MNATPQTAPGFMNRMNQSFIFQAWLVLLLASFFGAALAGVQLTLAPKIEANKLNETLLKVPELIFGVDGAKPMADRQMEIERRFFETGANAQKKTYSVFQAKTNGQTVGWVAKASGQGYADKIELLIGLDASAQTITGLFILDQKETPGLGNKIIEPVWRNQFIAKSTGQSLAAVKTKASALNEINAITGATISSKSVCDIVNQSLENLRQPLADAASTPQNASGDQPEQ